MESRPHHSLSGCRRFALLLAVAAAFVPANRATATTDAAGSRNAVAALRAYLEKNPKSTPDDLARESFASAPLTKEDAAAAQKVVWDDHAKRIRADGSDEIKDRLIRDGDLQMRFAYEIFGEKPAAGRSLFISMHGGGNAPARVNDQQYENQKHLYKPAEGIYLAPRAPTNTWNLWHEPHIDRMFARLIEDLLVLEDVDANRVYLMGYSAGGDGVYQLAPRMADRFAAASMMAGHPNDASPLGLRNLPFAIHVGALDGGYKRNEVAKEWGEKLDELQQADPGGYEHVVKLHEGRSHWMNREDAEAVPWMAKHTRDPLPKRIVWKQAGTTHDRLYWLAVRPGTAKGGADVVAERDGNTVKIIKADGADQVLIRLNDKMLDLDKPVRVTNGEKVLFEGVAPRTIGTLAKTLAERGDPEAILSAEFEVKPSAS